MILVTSASLVPGLDVPRRLLLVAAYLAPIPTALAIAVLLFRSARAAPRRDADLESARLLSVATAVRSGLTLRSAVADLSSDVARTVSIGARSEVVAARLAAVFPTQDRAVRAAFSILDAGGGPAGPVFEELAARAADDERVRRELRAAVAAPVLQGVLLAGAPLFVVARLLVSGDLLTTMSRSTGHAAVVVVGLCLTTIGAAWAFAIVRRSLP